MAQNNRNNNQNSELSSHKDDLLNWILRGAVTLLGLAIWFIYTEEQKTTKEFNAFKVAMKAEVTALKNSSTTNLDSEIDRSKTKDDVQQGEIDSNTEHRLSLVDHDLLIRLDERTKHLHMGEGGHGQEVKE